MKTKLVNNYCWKFDPHVLIEAIGKNKEQAFERLRLELAQGIMDGSYDECFKFEDISKVKPECYTPIDVHSFSHDALITIHNATR